MNILQEPIFQALFNTAVPRIILQANVPDFTIVTYNNAYEAATYTRNRDIRNQYLWEAFKPDTGSSNGEQTLSAALAEAVSVNKIISVAPFRYDIISDDADKTVVNWWQLEIVPVAGQDDKTEYLLVTTHNVTEQVLRKTAGNGQKKEKEQVAELEAANEKLWASNNNLAVNVEELKQSKQELEHFNISLEEIIGHRTKELIEREEELQAINEEMAASNEELKTANEQLEQTLRQKESLEKVLLEKEKQNQNTIKELEFLANTVPAVVWTSTPDGNLDFINNRWYDRNAQLIDQTLGSAWVANLHPDDMNRVLSTWGHSITTGDPYQIEFRVMDKEGIYRWYLVRALPLRDETGNILKWYGSNTDIQEQKELERQKDNFLGIVSHELKTPVTTIKAYLQIIHDMLSKSGEIKMAGLVEKTNKQIVRLNTLIGDLLDITKINTGKIGFTLTEFDFNKLVRDVVEDMQHTTLKHSIEMRLDFSGSVITDRERISQVITNLISNAIKYSPDATRIVIYTENTEAMVMLCVQDFGIGISPEKQDQVFEQFYRVSGNKEHVFPGLGLGLFISSEIVTRMGGRIWVNSIEGKGSTFCFTLPVNNKQLLDASF